ncbi:hypothetical protein D3C78_1709020 [compost metagenome]
MNDAHEAAGIALVKNLLALRHGADAEIARGGREVGGQHLIEQAAVHQPVANFVVQ